jgi:undecaprenyl diphosphate synthase
MAKPSPNARIQEPPRHVAIIMDGNGRWAKARGMPRLVGHQRGAEAVKKVVRSCRELKVPYLTLYAFSSENWKRPATEVDDLMGLLRLYLRRELADLHRNDIRVRFIGDRPGLAKDIIKLLVEAEETTNNNQTMTLVIALNYGGQSEIVQACRAIASEVKSGTLDVDDINSSVFERHLQTIDIPDPDLLIRTSGEQRLSNFLLWQSAYTELIFMNTLWPDFSKKNLEDAIDEYQQRERRYGAAPD